MGTARVERNQSRAFIDSEAGGEHSGIYDYRRNIRQVERLSMSREPDPDIDLRN